MFCNKTRYGEVFTIAGLVVLLILIFLLYKGYDEDLSDIHNEVNNTLEEANATGFGESYKGISGIMERYENTKLGFRIRYFGDWNLTSYNDGIRLISPNKFAPGELSISVHRLYDHFNASQEWTAIKSVLEGPPSPTGNISQSGILELSGQNASMKIINSDNTTYLQIYTISDNRVYWTQFITPQVHFHQYEGPVLGMLYSLELGSKVVVRPENSLLSVSVTLDKYSIKEGENERIRINVIDRVTKENINGALVTQMLTIRGQQRRVLNLEHILWEPLLI
jgi:hypothetical protein